MTIGPVELWCDHGVDGGRGWTGGGKAPSPRTHAAYERSKDGRWLWQTGLALGGGPVDPKTGLREWYDRAEPKRPVVVVADDGRVVHDWHCRTPRCAKGQSVNDALAQRVLARLGTDGVLRVRLVEVAAIVEGVRSF